MPKSVVLWQDDFPFYDALPFSEALLHAAFPRAAHVSVGELPGALEQADTSLLVLPYGSAFPFSAWDAIDRYLARGGHLLTVGGAPFSVPVHSRHYGFAPGRSTVAFQRALGINDSQAIGIEGLDLVATHASFSTIGGGWRARRSWALQVRLADESHYRRLGAMGRPAARLEPLLQARSAGGRVVATPAVLLDHFYGRYAGSRWVMLNFEAEDGFNGSEEAVRLYTAAQRVALRGPLRLDVRPNLSVVAPGEPPTIIFHAQAWQEHPSALVKLTCAAPDGGIHFEGQESLSLGHLPQHLSIALPAPAQPGLFRLEVQVRAGSQSLAHYTTGFYCRDRELLTGGSSLSAGAAFLERDGRPLPITGTTYMSRDAHRQFLLRPNPAHWHDDFAAMAEAGVNFVRTGIWSGHDQVMLEPGAVREDALRAFEAYLHAARAHGLAVQFCFFAFQPDAFGDGNPYLDPDARSRQRDFVAAFVRRFADVPDLSWDLINEPSQFDPAHLFQQRPHYDVHEAAAWNAWLQEHYPDYVSLLRAWNAAPADVGPWGDVRPPRPEELADRQRWGDDRPLMAVDWHRFSQDAFAGWAQDMTDAIRGCGSRQMVTVGQDEGAVDGRPSPFFHAGSLDHTCVHTWWLNDALLWDQLCATVPGKPLLVQETGIMHYERLDQGARRSEENRAHLLERKLALSLGAGSGYVQWLWNTNTDMADDNEVAIGALRADGSEKPELEVMRGISAWARAFAPHAGQWEPEPVLIAQTQSLLHSVHRDPSLRATRAAVRVSAYRAGLPCRVLGENWLDRAGSPALVIVPYPRALSQEAWQILLDLARRGSTVALSGPMGDEHFHATERLLSFGLDARVAPVTARHCLQDIPDGFVGLNYHGEDLNRIDHWRFEGLGSTWWQADLGAGRLLALSYSGELSADEGAAARIYGALMAACRHPIAPWHTVHGGAEGVLVWPRRFPGSTLYTCVSEADRDSELAFRDERSGTEVRLEVGSGRASLLLLADGGGPLAAYAQGRLELNGEWLWGGGEAALSWDRGVPGPTILHQAK